MKKRLIAFLCALTLLVGLLPAGAATAASEETTEQKYSVGYSIQDINPWVDPADHSKGILPIELTGNGNDSERVATGLMDDNDDREIGDGDGLYTTATAVTDSNGTTVIYVTIDALQGYDYVVTKVREGVVDALDSSVISEDQIMISASHSHSAPSISQAYESNPVYKAYYDYAIGQMVKAAEEAYADREEATMFKGSIDAKDSTASLGFNNGNGYHMNGSRHFERIVTTKDGAEVSNIAGNAFGSALNGSTPKNLYKIAETDNTMHILLFKFAEDSKKEDIVFVNWRAHATINSGGDNKSFVSSDYINSIRANLQGKIGPEEYRVAFFQGGAANVVPKPQLSNDWIAECNNKTNANIYGRILASVALDCIEHNMTPVAADEIKTAQIVYQGQVQRDSEGLLKAAQQCKQEKDPAFPYSYTHTDGKTYIINSGFHANQVVTRATYTNSNDGRLRLELNAIMLGKGVAFVTAPGELADQYDLAGSVADEDNDWLELVGKNYGTPFVLAYSSGDRGYLPPVAWYQYNTQEWGRETGYGEDGYLYYGAGSYEANTSRFASGTGEGIVANFKTMLDELSRKRSYCDACGEEKTWTPIYAADAITGTAWKSGHYYLYDDLSNYAGGTIECGETICLDLNGKQVSCSGRFFSSENVSSGDPAKLNIIDPMNTATVTSENGNNTGGLFFMKKPFTLSIYGGTFASEGTACRGGIAFVEGVLNLYRGTIRGGKVATDGDETGRGGAVSVSNLGRLYAYGGEILDGECSTGAVGSCVYLEGPNSTVYLEGNANVADIYLSSVSGYNLTINDVYTGEANLTLVSGQHGMDVGNADNADISNANITVNGDTAGKWKVFIDGANLRLDGYAVSTVAVIGDTEYTSVQSAIEASNGTLITMIRNEDKAVNVTKDAYLDLNGCDITGVVTANSGCTLYCKDSKTDDYTVADAQGNLIGYGKITNIAAGAKENIKGIPEEATVADITVDGEKIDDGYLMVTESDGVSFHRVNLDLTAMALRASAVGVYYESAFAGDEVVASKIVQFGVALSVRGEPTASNMETDCKYSWFGKDYFKHGEKENAATSTVVHSVMKTANMNSINRRNAAMPIYGRAYILTEYGYMFGQAKSRSFREQVEAANGIWADLKDTQKPDIIAMYKTFKAAMSDWDVAAIANSASE